MVADLARMPAVLKHEARCLTLRTPGGCRLSGLCAHAGPRNRWVSTDGFTYSPIRSILKDVFMLRRDLLRSLLAMPLPAWLRHGMPRLFSGADSQEADASVLYRNAFGWTKGLRPEDPDRLRNAATIGVDVPDIDALIRHARSALISLRKAAAMRQYDWGVEPMSANDLGKGRLDVSGMQLIRVACLSARRHAAKQRFDEALDDVFAGLTLAHRIGTGGLLIARFLEFGGEVPAFQTLGRVLPLLDLRALDDLSHRLDALPSPEPASATIGPESRFILGSIRAKIMNMDALIDGEDWAELGFSDQEAANLKRLTGGDRTALLAHLESTVSAFAELARRLDLARPGCRAALHEFGEAERCAHPVAAMLVESAWSIRHVVDRMLALRAMLKAGLALIRAGEPAFRVVTDRFGTGPFALEHIGNGYLIRSALKDAGRPEVTLVVGDPP
jgi:hypothetical protein